MNAAFLADYLGLGALIESLKIAATARGYEANVVALPRGEGPVARLTLQKAEGPLDAHAAWLDARETNREDGDSSALGEGVQRALEEQAARHGVGLSFVQGTNLAALADTLGASDRVRLLNPGLHANLVDELRWTPEEVTKTRDGIDIRSLGLDPAGMAALQLLARGDVVETLREEKLGKGLERIGRSAVTSSSAAVLFTAPDLSLEQGCRTGRALQRVWLEATRLGLGLQPIGTALFMHRMLDSSVGSVFDPEEAETLVRAMHQIRTLFEVEGADEAVLLCRLHRPTAKVKERSLRRELGAVLRVGG